VKNRPANSLGKALNGMPLPLSRGATRILLRGERGLENEKYCDVILMTYFRWRNLMTSPK